MSYQQRNSNQPNPPDDYPAYQPGQYSGGGYEPGEPVSQREQQKPLIGDVLPRGGNLSINVPIDPNRIGNEIRDEVRQQVRSGNLGRDLLNSWINLLTHPTLATFKAQGAKTSWLVAISSVLVMGIIAAIVGTIRGIAGNVVFGVIGAIPNLLITPLLTIGGFFLVAIVLYLVAGRLGGNGGFSTQTKLLALLAPLFSVALLVATPRNLIFSIIGLVVGLYVVFLMYQMVRAAHNLDQRNAAIIVALPALLVLLGIIF